MFSGVFTRPKVDILIDVPEGRKNGKIQTSNGEIIKLPFLEIDEKVSGKIIINCSQCRDFEHKGIHLELFGIIENISDPKDIFKFISLNTDIEPFGILKNEINTFPFDFKRVQKQYESYRGETRNIKYFLRLLIDTKLKTLIYEKEFLVMNTKPKSILNENNKPIKIEVGVEDWLHLVFQLNSRNYSINDTLIGKITFKKVSIKMTKMDIQITKKEIINIDNINNEPISTILTLFEIMDGGPIKNEEIPIRLYLKPYNLTPSFETKRFSVKFFVSIVLTDVENRKYYKHHEISVFRIEKEKKKNNDNEN